ncbi:MAG: hypothetical protein FJX91_01270 [Bacteroidetes bacterium]|nr:hypothetical protein [Bacteroidota bacterium]
MKLKFNHIQDLSDARYAAAAMAEWIGFRVGEIPLAQVQEIIGWCAGPKLTLELHDANLKDMAISWCDILPVDAIECPESDLSFWQSTLTNPTFEWITVNGDTAKVHSDPTVTITLVDPSTQAAEDIKQMDLEALSLNCEKEMVVGMKNYDLWNDLLETLEIW